MNVYDQAHSLATAVKESEEYKQFQARKKDIEGNPELEKALNDFLKQQFEMQAAQAPQTRAACASACEQGP